MVEPCENPMSTWCSVSWYSKQKGHNRQEDKLQTSCIRQKLSELYAKADAGSHEK